MEKVDFFYYLVTTDGMEREREGQRREREKDGRNGEREREGRRPDLREERMKEERWTMWCGVFQIRELCVSIKEERQTEWRERERESVP